MNISSITLPDESQTTLEGFKETTYAGTAFGKLLLDLASAPWMQEFEVASRLHFNDDKDVVGNLWLRHDSFLTEKGDHTIQVPCTLTEVPTVSGVARLASEALQAGISSRTAVRQMLAYQNDYAGLAQVNILDLFARSVFLSGTGAKPAFVSFKRHFVHCLKVSGPGSLIVKMSELFTENPTVYVVHHDTVALSRFDGPWDKDNPELPEGAEVYVRPVA